MSLVTPKGIHYAKLRNVQKQLSKPIIEDTGSQISTLKQTLSENQDDKSNLFIELHKDLNQDNLSYINSLLKGRSTSQQPTNQEKKVVQSDENKILQQQNHNRAKSFFEKTFVELDDPSPKIIQNVASLQNFKNEFNQSEEFKQIPILQKQSSYNTDFSKDLNEIKNNKQQQNHHYPTKDSRGTDSLSSSILNSNNTSQQTQINFVMKENQQEKLFDQFFKQNNSTENEAQKQTFMSSNFITKDNNTDSQPQSRTFLEFIDQQINYHSIPTQVLKKDLNPKIDNNPTSVENKTLKSQVLQLTSKLQQFNQSRKELIAEYSQYKNRHDEERHLFKILNQENKQQKYELQAQQAEIKHLKKQKLTNNKKCEILQQLLVRERIERENNLMTLNKYYAHNYNKDFNSKKMQEMMQNMHAFKPQIVQETVSSLADEKFESNDQSLKSSLSHGSLDLYEKKPIEQLQKRMMHQVSTQDVSRVMMMQQYDHKSRNNKEKVYYKFDETSNDITNNSMFSAHQSD